jgi:simple sugar transport system substrate-binding protein/basic membrane protein A
VTIALALAVALSLAAATVAYATGSNAAAKKIAVFFVGAKNNRSFGNSVYIGATSAASALKSNGVTVKTIDNMNTPDQYQQQGSAFINQGYNFLLFANGGVPQVVSTLTKQFPNVFICEVAATITPLPSNGCTVNMNFQYGDFLAGVIAGSITKTNHVGIIIGPPFPVLTSEAEGFLLGARWVNPKVKLTETAISSYTDVAPARAAALSQYGSGVDVILSATDQATQGIFQAAETKSGVWVVPQYFDSYSLAPKVVLTTVLFNINGVVKRVVQMAAAGKLTSKNYVFGYNAGVGRLAPFHANAKAVSPTARRRLAIAKAWMASGKLKVPFLGNIGDAKKYNLKNLPKAPK